MRPITLFMNVSLDGYFETPDHDVTWAKADFQAFPDSPDDQADTILLGRTTYDMMLSFWPTPQAEALYPHIARYMNRAEKICVTHRPFEATWNNTTIVSENVIDTVRKLKQQPGSGIVILGSNNLSVQLMQAGLIDSFDLIVNPVALGEGTPLFTGLADHAEMVLLDSQNAASGAVRLTYKPA